jgi:cyclic pyranopterin phosphate synthase
MDPNSAEFSHLDASGSARMVDVGHKPPQRRTARAEGFVRCQPATIRALRERALPKGDVLTVSKIAGIQAAKRTGELIPLCHPLPIDVAEVDFDLEMTECASDPAFRLRQKPASRWRHSLRSVSLR